MKPENRHDRRADKTRRRLILKRGQAVTLLSYVAAVSARIGRMTRNAARRRLQAEVERRYGSVEARRIGVRLVQFDGTGT